MKNKTAKHKNKKRDSIYQKNIYAVDPENDKYGIVISPKGGKSYSYQFVQLSQNLVSPGKKTLICSAPLR